MAVRFSAAELAAVDAAAVKDGMVTAAWVGEVALAAADPVAPMAEARVTRAKLDAVVQAVNVVRRVGYLLNQAVAAFHSTGEPPESLLRVTGLTWRVVQRLEDELLAVIRRTRRSR